MFKKLFKRKKEKFSNLSGPKIEAEKLAVLIVLLVVISVSVYFIAERFWPGQPVKQSVVSAEDQKVLAELGKIMLLPENVTPTMAIITDIDKLKADQPDFFADAKNGDRLIVYPTQAIIFDSEANKIIKVGAVKLNQNEQVRMVKFAVYNGSGAAGAAETAAKKLQSVFNNIEITEKSDAARKDYEKTLVVDLGTDIDIAKFAEIFGIEVASLPEGEKKPEGAEMLIIVGKE